MLFRESSIRGVFLIDPEPRADERGFFARTWDPALANARGLQERFDYTCVSTNIATHTLRGMHYQRDPHGEVKLVRCTRGSIFDVVIDLRPNSATFKRWYGAELSADNHRSLYIPRGCAHGFLTRTAHAEVLYHIAGAFSADAAAGVRFDDPAFGIAWPAAAAVIADRDRRYPDFSA